MSSSAGSGGYRFRTISRDCPSDDAARAKGRLCAAQEAGLLDSFDGAIHDGARLVVMLDQNRMLDPSGFACEIEIATRVLDRALSLHSGPTDPPKD